MSEESTATTEEEKKPLTPEEQRAVDWEAKKLARSAEKRALKAKLAGRVVSPGVPSNRQARRQKARANRIIGRHGGIVTKAQKQAELAEDKAKAEEGDA